MNRKSRILLTLATVVLTFGLFSFERPTSAQSPKSRAWGVPRGSSAQSTLSPLEDSDCEKPKQLKGIVVQVFDPATGISSGPITHGGILNGTMEDVINFDAGVVFTPDPNVVTYISDVTISTVDGQLKISPVTSFNVVTGFWSEWGSINPDTSTGRFAGATGVIFFSGKTIGNLDTGPYEGKISGEICLEQ